MWEVRVEGEEGVCRMRAGEALVQKRGPAKLLTKVAKATSLKSYD